MRCHHALVLALLACIVVDGSRQYASAQAWANNRYAQNTPQPAAHGKVEELPMGARPAGAPTAAPASSGHYDEQFPDGSANPVGEYGCGPDSCGGYQCGEPNCATGCGSECGSGCGSWSGFCGFGGNSGSWFFTADYLNVRAHFSDALSFVEQVETQTLDTETVARTFHQFDFDRESSFRVGGGYRLCCCGEKIAFNFTQFRGNAEDSFTAPDRDSGRFIALPFNPFPDQDPTNPFLNPDTPQSARTRASVDADTYDLEWRKTIPLGGTSCSDCGNPCGYGDCTGCGDCCGSRCPAWDITWGGGVRGATVDADRRYILIDPDTAENGTDTKTDLTFEGAGPRFGMEGRRYFGRNGWFSIFMKGDISLLLGQLEVDTVQSSVNDNGITEFERQRFQSQQMIPITEIEAGISASVTCHSTFSAGYLVSAWHDMGFRDEAVVGTQVLDQQLVTHYDDANIMSFDGVFARWEWVY